MLKSQWALVNKIFYPSRSGCLLGLWLWTIGYSDWTILGGLQIRRFNNGEKHCISPTYEKWILEF